MNKSTPDADIFLFRADGGSMWPFIRGGDRLLCRSGVLPRVGELALYRNNGRVICHRVTGIQEGQSPIFKLRGDFSGGPEEPVEAARITGVVIEILRGGRAINAGRTKGRLLLALLPAIRPGLRGLATLYMAGKSEAARLLRKKGYNG